MSLLYQAHSKTLSMLRYHYNRAFHSLTVGLTVGMEKYLLSLCLLKTEDLYLILKRIVFSACGRLSGCQITKEGCASLAAALTTNPSRLKELDLSYNHPDDSGIKLLSAALKDPRFTLTTLRYVS